MSIFQNISDINFILLKFLDILDLINFSQVNKYYGGLINNYKKYNKSKYFYYLMGFKNKPWSEIQNIIQLETKFKSKSDQEKINNILNIYYTINKPEIIYFNQACISNNLFIMKYLYQKYKLDLHINHDYIFRLACLKNHKKIAKWLFSLSQFIINSEPIIIKIINPEKLLIISDNFEEPFLLACYYNKLEIIKWLYKLSLQIKNPIKFIINPDNSNKQILRVKPGLRDWLIKILNINFNK